MCPTTSVLGSEKATMAKPGLDSGEAGLPVRERVRLFQCVDFKIERLEIIDSSASTEAIRVKYGDTPENVKLLLIEYFTSVGEKFKSIICENLNCKRMAMKWRDTGNDVECGLYLMRHMESYVGERVTKWDCGLTRGV
nr:putative ulp1 protease family, C-terminal catalytic domain-containing protein [Ipomoea batatas]